MALSTTAQFKTLLAEKKHFCITFRRQHTPDAIASAVALFVYLKKQGKTVDVIADNFDLPQSLRFLKAAREITSQFRDLQKFIISVDINKHGLKELSYDTKDDKLRVFVTPKEGFLTHDAVKTAHTDFLYDAIIVVGTQDLASLGDLYENNTALFHETPTINIDASAANEHFGDVNIIDITKASTAEVVFDLLQDIDGEDVTDEIATALLTGIIATTRSFKTSRIKPQTLDTASKLMKLGANREHIIDNLYRTRTLGSLKLWGQALNHLEHDQQTGLAWSTITRDDFVRTGANEQDLHEIIDELISNSPEAKVTLLLHEHAKNGGSPEIHGLIYAGSGHKASELVAKYKPEGDDSRASFIIHNKPLIQAKNEVVGLVKQRMLEQR